MWFWSWVTATTDKIFSIKAGLLLASTGAFLTTTPPTSPGTAGPLLDYTLFVPYTLLVLSFATALGSLIVVGGLQFVVRSCEQRWFRRVRFHILNHFAYDNWIWWQIVASDHFCVYLTMFLLAYPYFSLAVSTLVCALGQYVCNQSYQSHWPFLPNS